MLGPHEGGKQGPGDVLGQGFDGVVQFRPGDDPVDQAHLHGLRRADGLRGVEVLICTLVVHEHPWLDHRLPAREAETLDQRHLEVGVVRGDGDVGTRAQ